MSRYRLDALPVWTARAGCACVLALLVGCAELHSPAAGGHSPAAGDGAEAARSVTPPRLERDGDQGFTLTEVVHIDSDVRNDYQRAIGLLRQNQPEEGIRLLESVVQRAPDIAIPHIDLGLAYERSKEFDKAEKSFLAALAVAPDHPAALNELGILYRRMGRFEDARASYEHVLKLYPSFHYALLNLGILCDLYLEDLDCALKNYQAYSTVAGDNKQVHIWIADVENRLKNPQQEQ